MRSWIIYKACGPGNKAAAVNLGITDVIAETYNSSGRAVKEGDRPTVFWNDTAPKIGPTLMRKDSDWVVHSVEEYPANIPGMQEFDQIVIAKCFYQPINDEWRELNKPIVSVESFGGNEELFEEYKEQAALATGDK